MGGGPGEKDASKDGHEVAEQYSHGAAQMIPASNYQDAKGDENDGEDE